MSIIGHVEKFLGKISQGWKEKYTDGAIQVVCFERNPFEPLDIFLTLGLSNHKLKVSDKKKVRQELVFPISGEVSHAVIVSCLLFLCDLMLKDHSALLRGQVIRLPKEAADKLGFYAVYCAIPVFLDDGFATFYGSEPPMVMVWIMPIHKTEADFIADNGWDRFEDVLEQQDQDLFFVGRNPVI